MFLLSPVRTPVAHSGLQRSLANRLGEGNSALFAARLLQAAEIEFLPAYSLLEAATRIALEIGHPAYDCLYLALAAQLDCRFATADERFVRKLHESGKRQFRRLAISLTQAAEELSRSTD